MLYIRGTRGHAHESPWTTLLVKIFEGLFGGVNFGEFIGIHQIRQSFALYGIHSYFSFIVHIHEVSFYMYFSDVKYVAIFCYFWINYMQYSYSYVNWYWI